MRSNFASAAPGTAAWVKRSVCLRRLRWRPPAGGEPANACGRRPRPDGLRRILRLAAVVDQAPGARLAGPIIRVFRRRRKLSRDELLRGGFDRRRTAALVAGAVDGRDRIAVRLTGFDGVVRKCRHESDVGELLEIGAGGSAVDAVAGEVRFGIGVPGKLDRSGRGDGAQTARGGGREDVLRGDADRLGELALRGAALAQIEHALHHVRIGLVEFGGAVEVLILVCGAERQEIGGGRSAAQDDEISRRAGGTGLPREPDAFGRTLRLQAGGLRRRRDDREVDEVRPGAFLAVRANDANREGDVAAGPGSRRRFEFGETVVHGRRGQFARGRGPSLGAERCDRGADAEVEPQRGLEESAFRRRAGRREVNEDTAAALYRGEVRDCGGNVGEGRKRAAYIAAAREETGCAKQDRDRPGAVPLGCGAPFADGRGPVLLHY